MHDVVDGHCSCILGLECKSQGKHPRVKRELALTAGDQEWAVWMRRWPTMNLGLLTGYESGIFVIDVDPRHGGDQSFKKLTDELGQFPETMVAQTGGGGYHYVFQLPQGLEIKNSAGLIAPGIDIRGFGGVIVVEPSVTQGAYKWL
jgi:hypothetical protein